MLLDHLNQLPDRTVWIVLILATCSSWLYYVWSRFFSLQGLPRTIPWAGAERSALRRGRASWKSFLGLRELLIDGYENHSKQGRPFILPNIVAGHEVIIPPSQIQWLLGQPDHVLSQREATNQFLSAEYTMLHPTIFAETRIANFVSQHFTRDLDVFANAIVDEIDQALEDIWGTNTTKWKEIDVFNVMIVIVGRVLNRVLVGLPLCRDPKYVESITKFGQLGPVTGGMISLLPAWLKPALGPLITAYDTFHSRRISRMIEPIVRERLLTIGSPAGLKKHLRSQPNDYIQWALIESFNHGEQVKDMPGLIAKRLAVLGFAAIQSSALTITNALFDIAASSESLTIQNTLRMEAEMNAERKDGKNWAKESLAAMTTADSVLRETLRLWSFVSHGVTKVVVAPQGVTLPSGEYLPRGAKVGLASYGPHHDDKIYADPYTFDSFRFCAESNAKKSLVTTSTYFMGFSHGRHACPGRFFASQQMKLLLSVISLKYDIRPLSKRPESKWLNNMIGADIWATLEVRRRSGTTSNVAEDSQSESGRASGRSSPEIYWPGGLRRTGSDQARDMC